VLSLALHAVLAAMLVRARRPATPARIPIELTVLASPRPATPPRSPSASPLERSRAASLPRPAATAVRESLAAPSSRRSAAAPASERLSPAPERLSPAPPRVRESPAPPTPPAPAPHIDLFARAALDSFAASDAPADRAPSAAERAWRPRRGVGGVDAAGGVDVGSFLAEDAARQRVTKGAVLPELRQLERRLDNAFTPTFVQADISNRAELFIKQMRGFLRNPPKTGELARGIDPARETYYEKLRSMRPEQASFLGRRVEVYVRQKPDGSIIEMAVRNASGYRGFDDAALAAVERALAGRPPAGAGPRAGEVRTLWQLDATAYVVVSPNPELQFDEATGKHEWIYPLQKRVDHHVRLIAVY